MTIADPAAEIRQRLALGHHAEAGELARAMAAADPSDPLSWRLLAKALIGQGKAPETQQALERAAILAPLPPDARGDLAAAHLLRGELDQAGRLIEEAIADDPDDPVLWRRKAILEERRGNAGLAESAYVQALQRAPDDAALHNNHGIFLRRQGRNEAAAAALRQAVALDPKRAEYRANVAATLRMAGQFEAALQAYRETIALAPAREDMRLALIATLRIVGRVDEALQAARDAAAALPASTRIMIALAAVLLDTGDAGAALAAATAATETRPDEAEAWLHVGNALRALDRREEAAAAYRKLLAQMPDDVQALTNLGLVSMESGDVAAAAALAERAVALAPANADALHVAGTIAEVAGDAATAERHFREALRLRPRFAEAEFSLGWLLLSRGRLREGQRGFDQRWHLPRFDKWRRPFELPMWDGAPLAGRRLLVWGDHGPGDEIMYARLVDRVAAAGGTVILECEPRLAPLFTRAFPAVAVVPRSDPPHPATRTADLQCPTGSLVGRLHADPSALPQKPLAHLRADPARARALREKYQDGRLLVGVSWNSRHPTIGGEKSLDLEAWLPILKAPDCRFVSVQYGDHGGEIDALRRRTGISILADPEIDPLLDLDGAAAQIAALDLVITISNTAAHLSGALGVPTWTLVPKGRGLFWYWFLDRGDSPWYPAMRLHRQTADKDWTGLIATVARDLAALRQG